MIIPILNKLVGGFEIACSFIYIKPKIVQGADFFVLRNECILSEVAAIDFTQTKSCQL